MKVGLVFLGVIILALAIWNTLSPTILSSFLGFQQTGWINWVGFILGAILIVAGFKMNSRRR